ncbi:MAG: hypothetical protein AAF602_15280 [Myxococcota bacterium]
MSTLNPRSWVAALVAAALTTGCLIDGVEVPDTIRLGTDDPTEPLPPVCDDSPEEAGRALAERALDVGLELERIRSVRLPDGHLVATARGRDGQLVLSNIGASGDAPLPSGFFEVEATRAETILLWLGPGPDDLTEYRVAGPDPVAAATTTPLGDDLCGDAPDELQSFCQDFVMCAAYELWC